MQLTVLGATGGAGQAITRELAARGHHVVAASRSAPTRDWPDGVTARACDLTDPAATAAACQDADVVVMAAQVPYARWVAELPLLVERAADAAAAAEARFVLVDNLYAYGSPGTPMRETSPEAATTRKGRLRAALGQALLARHASGRQRVTIGRFADYYGPFEGSSLVNQLLLAPAARGRTPRVFVADDQPHTFHALADAGRGFATLIEDERADGQVWLLPAAPPITQGELLRLAGDALGRELSAGRVTPRMLWLLGLVSPQLREAREVVPQFDRPYTIDARAFETTFGSIEVTPHAEVVARTIAWFRGREAVSA
ncbi:MAG: NAD-dependent epimerase/dehydratase family protein [Nitriliruptoraceae bacterium]